MALSRLAAEFAAEIQSHDWSDAPWRLDRAGHRRSDDRSSRRSEQQLTETETECVRVNVMWVTAQVLAFNDPNFDVHEYATACGVPRGYTHTSSGRLNGMIDMGLRYDYDVERGTRTVIPGSQRAAPPGRRDEG
jgi:hypothetical protein